MPAVRFGVVLWPQATDWPALRAAAVLAERSGLDSAWTWDHLTANIGPIEVPIFEGWTAITAIAAATTRIGIGPLVMANSFRNPGLLAKAAATLDHVSGGRLTLGLGTGANERDHVAFGIEGGGRGADSLGFGRLTEAVPLLRRLLDGETVTHHGPHYRLEAALCSPRPLQRRLPILIGGTGPRRTLPLVAAHADAWNAAGPLDAVTSAAKRLDELCDEIGRDPTSIERTLVKGIAIRRDRRQAREVFMAALRHNGEADPEGYAPVVGTPAEVAAELRPFVELGFRHVLCSLPSPFDAETIERLGEVRALLG